MSSIDEELQAVENTLKKCAEELGQLNLDNNKVKNILDLVARRELIVID